MNERMIPQCDPRAGYRAYRQELDEAWQRVMESGRYILGEEVNRFEREFASYLGAVAAIGTGSGTDAISLALRLIGVRPGDRVLTVSHTAVATLSAIEVIGARPVFVDIDPSTFTMDPNSLMDAIRRDQSRSWELGELRAIIPVHLYGQLADMPAITDIAQSYGLRVVEDCAQCHGAALMGRMAANWGDAAAFSFYPTKNLGTFGDGGAVVVRDESAGDRCRALREYGWDRQRISQESGINSRLDELHAALLRVRLRHLDRDNEARRGIAEVYNQRLAGSSIIPPPVRPGAVHVYHQYVIRSTCRDDLRAKLADRGVATAIHYTPAAHQHPNFLKYVDNECSLRQTERAANEILSLPMFPQLPSAQAHRVADALLDCQMQRVPAPKAVVAV